MGFVPKQIFDQVLLHLYVYLSFYFVHNSSKQTLTQFASPWNRITTKKEEQIKRSFQLTAKCVSSFNGASFEIHFSCSSYQKLNFHKATLFSDILNASTFARFSFHSLVFFFRHGKLALHGSAFTVTFTGETGCIHISIGKDLQLLCAQSSSQWMGQNNKVREFKSIIIECFI